MSRSGPEPAAPPTRRSGAGTAGSGISPPTIGPEQREEKAETWEGYAPRWPPPTATAADARSRLESVTDDFPRVSSALRALGVPPTGPGGSGPTGFNLDPRTLRATVRFANRTRSRFSVLDRLDSQGRIDHLARQMTERSG